MGWLLMVLYISLGAKIRDLYIKDLLFTKQIRIYRLQNALQSLAYRSPIFAIQPYL